MTQFDVEYVCVCVRAMCISKKKNQNLSATSATKERRRDTGKYCVKQLSMRDIRFCGCVVVNYGIDRDNA